MEILLDLIHINKSSLGSSMLFKFKGVLRPKCLRTTGLNYYFFSNEIVLTLSCYTEQMFVSLSCPDRSGNSLNTADSAAKSSPLVVLLSQHMASTIAAAEEKTGRQHISS